MKILVASNGAIVMSGFHFAFGAWEEADRVNDVIVHKWALLDEANNTLMYILDENQRAIDGTEPPAFIIHEVNEIPNGTEIGKYLFLNGEFVLNPNWVEPPKSDAERIAELEALVAKQKEQLQQADDTAIELFEAQLAQEEINQAQDDALIELWEIVEQQGGE